MGTTIQYSGMYVGFGAWLLKSQSLAQIQTDTSVFSSLKRPVKDRIKFDREGTITDNDFAKYQPSQKEEHGDFQAAYPPHWQWQIC